MNVLVLQSPRAPHEFWARADIDGFRLTYKSSPRKGVEKMIEYGAGRLHHADEISDIFLGLECIRRTWKGSSANACPVI